MIDDFFMKYSDFISIVENIDELESIFRFTKSHTITFHGIDFTVGYKPSVYGNVNLSYELMGDAIITRYFKMDDYLRCDTKNSKEIARNKIVINKSFFKRRDLIFNDKGVSKFNASAVKQYMCENGLNDILYIDLKVKKEIFATNHPAILKVLTNCSLISDIHKLKCLYVPSVVKDTKTKDLKTIKTDIIGHEYVFFTTRRRQSKYDADNYRKRNANISECLNVGIECFFLDMTNHSTYSMKDATMFINTYNRVFNTNYKVFHVNTKAKLQLMELGLYKSYNKFHADKVVDIYSNIPRQLFLTKMTASMSFDNQLSTKLPNIAGITDITIKKYYDTCKKAEDISKRYRKGRFADSVYDYNRDYMYLYQWSCAGMGKREDDHIEKVLSKRFVTRLKTKIDTLKESILKKYPLIDAVNSHSSRGNQLVDYINAMHKMRSEKN